MIGPTPITAIKRSSDGVLWLGTESGLFRYDGARLLHFSASKKGSGYIPVSYISQIVEAPGGPIMIATPGAGLLTFDQNTVSFAARAETSPYQPNQLYLHDLLISGSGDIWLLSRDGVSLYNPVGRHAKELDSFLRHSSALSKPVAIEENVNGDILVSTLEGLVIVDPELKESEPFDSHEMGGERRGSVSSIHLHDDKYLYLGTDNGFIYSLDPYSYDLVASMQLSQRDKLRITGMIVLDEYLIASTDNGIFKLDQDLKNRTNISMGGHGLSSMEVLDMERDGNSIWIGTYRGLQILSFSNFGLHRPKDGFYPRDVTSLSLSKDNQLWIGTYKGLYRFNELTGEYHRFGGPESDNRLVDQRISSLGVSKGKLWVSFFSGGIQLVELEKGVFSDVNLDHLQDIQVTKILHDRNQLYTWLGTSSNGLLRTPTDTGENRQTESYLYGHRIMDIFETSEGEILAASRNKLFRYTQETNDFEVLGVVSPEIEQISVEIYAIAEGVDGDLFLGTNDYGIYRIEDFHSSRISSVERLSRFRTEPSTIYTLEVDNDGYLWASTKTGIVKYRPDGSFVARFTQIDGLQSDEFELGASATSERGELFFGGPNGYNRFWPAEIAIDPRPSEIQLAGIEFPTSNELQVFNERSDLSLVLTHRDRFVTFWFSILDYTSPTRNQFRYKLEGFDDDWIESGSENFARYTNLPPGEFVFRVQAANPAGIWNTDGLAVNVSKSPPPWMTGWAFLIYTAIFALFWWASNRVYQSYTFKRKTVELQNQKLAQEIRSHDEMQEQLEIQSHLLRSAHQHNLSTLSVLDTVMTPTATTGLEDDGSHGLRWLEILRELENSIHYFADNPTADLNAFTNTILSQALDESPVPPHSVVTINDVTETPIPTAAASPLAIILHELIENSIQHAFSAEGDVHYLQVRLAQKTAVEMGHYHWELQVIDNGVGLEPGEQNKGRGLQVVQTLVESLGGTIEVETGHGTHVTVRLPPHQSITEPESNALPA